MGCYNFEDLKYHVGHKIVCVMYGEQNDSEKEDRYIQNVAIECEDCKEVLMDFDKSN